MLIQEQVSLPSLPLKDVCMKAWVVPKDGVPGTEELSGRVVDSHPSPIPGHEDRGSNFSSLSMNSLAIKSQQYHPEGFLGLNTMYSW